MKLDKDTQDVINVKLKRMKVSVQIGWNNDLFLVFENSYEREEISRMLDERRSSYQICCFGDFDNALKLSDED